MGEVLLARASQWVCQDPRVKELKGITREAEAWWAAGDRDAADVLWQRATALRLSLKADGFDMVAVNKVARPKLRFHAA